jgi:hypothetical protein
MDCVNHSGVSAVAYCQNCGKALCTTCVRNSGNGQILCEPCQIAWQSYQQPFAAPSSGPNPSAAAVLGIIPGVGAMYNGQYAKGVVHLIVFAILVSLADEHGIFGLFIAGWVCYQVIEAHHTAKARRDGTPLPNPFGLNDLGERLGFGKSWPGSGTSASSTQQSTASVPPSQTSNPYTPPSAGYAPPSAAWSTPSWESYASPGAQTPPYGNPGYPMGAPGYPVDPNLSPLPRNRFPAGAIWLIGLGCLFLVGNAGLFHSFPIHRLVPFLLIGFGVWIFVRKMTDTGSGLADDGTPGYQFRLFRALRGSIWIVLIGVLFLLDSFDILSWGHSWPVIIIVAGLMAIFQRSSYSAAMAASYPYPAPPSPPPPADPGASIVPSTRHDQEGR